MKEFLIYHKNKTNINHLGKASDSFLNYIYYICHPKLSKELIVLKKKKKGQGQGWGGKEDSKDENCSNTLLTSWAGSQVVSTWMACVGCQMARSSFRDRNLDPKAEQATY